MCLCVCEQGRQPMDVYLLCVQSTVALLGSAGKGSSNVLPDLRTHAGEHAVELCPSPCPSPCLYDFMSLCLSVNLPSLTPPFLHQQQCQYLLLYLCTADEDQTFATDPTLYVSLFSLLFLSTYLPIHGK